MRRARRIRLGLILCLSFCCRVEPAPAQGAADAVHATRATREQLHRILDSARVAAGVPALGGALVTRDSVLMFDAVGMRRAGGTRPVKAGDAFHIGSDAKAMTAGWIAQQVDAGRITWTTTITDVFPALAKEVRPEYRGVTLLDLLSHQSGLPADAFVGACPRRLPVPPRCGFDDGPPRAERRRALAWAIRQPPVAKRGTFAYSNVGYVIAAAMVEARLGEDFESSIVTRLLAPLGMTTIGFGAAGTPGTEDQPWGHRPERGGTYRPIPPGPAADLPAIHDVSGAVHLSLSDWGLWIRTVLRAEAGLPSLWTPETARTLTIPVATIDSSNSYALGWGVGTLTRTGATQRVLGHQGSNGMNSADVIVFPDAGFGLLVVPNAGGRAAGDVASKTKLRLIDLYLTGK
jgi:CubicO group peptidase (beta-lactamase class C family)